MTDSHVSMVYLKQVFSTRFECIFTSSPPVSSVFLNLLHSFRVYFKQLHLPGNHIDDFGVSILVPSLAENAKALEYLGLSEYASSPLVSSVVSHLLHSFRV